MSVAPEQLEATPAVLERAVLAPVRSSALDGLRGLAILLMVVDHVALFAHADVLRVTVGRVAMPLFFIVGGHLALRYAWRRWAQVLAVGIVLQLLAPWTGSGPLLLTFVAGAVVVAGLRRWPVLLALLVGWGLTLGANGWAHLHGIAYDPRLLVALMAFGALLPRSSFDFGARLPRPVVWAGQHPLALYAGHALFLTALVN